MDQKNKPSWAGTGNLIRSIAGVETGEDDSDITSDVDSDATTDSDDKAASLIQAYVSGEKKAPTYAETHVRKTYYFKPEHHRRLVRMSKQYNRSVSSILEDALTLFFVTLDEQKRGKKDE